MCPDPRAPSRLAVPLTRHRPPGWLMGQFWTPSLNITWTLLCSRLQATPTVFRFWGNQRLNSSSIEATGQLYTQSFPHAPSKCLLNTYLPGPLWEHKSPPLPQGQHLKTGSKGPVGVAQCSQEAGLQDPQVQGEQCFHSSKPSTASSVVLV